MYEGKEEVKSSGKLDKLLVAYLPVTSCIFPFFISIHVGSAALNSCFYEKKKNRKKRGIKWNIFFFFTYIFIFR